MSATFHSASSFTFLRRPRRRATFNLSSHEDEWLSWPTCSWGQIFSRPHNVLRVRPVELSSVSNEAGEIVYIGHSHIGDLLNRTLPTLYCFRVYRHRTAISTAIGRELRSTKLNLHLGRGAVSSLRLPSFVLRSFFLSIVELFVFAARSAVNHKRPLHALRSYWKKSLSEKSPRNYCTVTGFCCEWRFPSVIQ